MQQDLGPGWQPDHETDIAIKYIDKHKDNKKPFAMILSYHPPHNGNYPSETHERRPTPGS